MEGCVPAHSLPFLLCVFISVGIFSMLYFAVMSEKITSASVRFALLFFVVVIEMAMTHWEYIQHTNCDSPVLSPLNYLNGIAAFLAGLAVIIKKYSPFILAIAVITLLLWCPLFGIAQL